MIPHSNRIDMRVPNIFPYICINILPVLHVGSSNFPQFPPMQHPSWAMFYSMFDGTVEKYDSYRLLWGWSWKNWGLKGKTQTQGKLPLWNKKMFSQENLFWILLKRLKVIISHLTSVGGSFFVTITSCYVFLVLFATCYGSVTSYYGLVFGNLSENKHSRCG